MTTCPSCKSTTFCEQQTCKAGLLQKLQSLHNKHSLKVDKQRYFHCRLTINQNLPTNEQMIVHHWKKTDPSKYETAWKGVHQTQRKDLQN